MRTFKLDMVDLVQVCALTDGDESEDGLSQVLEALARQLRDHGAPNAPFEQQAQQMLTAFTALQQAEAEMPGLKEQARLVAMAEPVDIVAGVWDLFRPIVARLTQERDEARNELAAILPEPGEPSYRVLTLTVERLAEERDALRQRAERAERERNASREEGVSLRELNNALRARVAELEASREPALSPEEGHRIWAELYGPGGKYAQNSHEPGADAVERLCVEYAREAVTQGVKDVSPNGIRAVLARLAAMGEDAVPTLQDIAKEWPADGLPEDGPGGWDGIITVALRIVRSRLSPVLGALRAEVVALKGSIASAANGSGLLQARVTDLEADLAAAKADGVRVAEEAREAARVALGERRELQAAVAVCHVHELSSCSHCDGEGGRQ